MILVHLVPMLLSVANDVQRSQTGITIWPLSEEILTGPEHVWAKIDMSLSDGQQDRRQHVRIPLTCSVRLLREGCPTCIRAETRDISSGGFYCLANQPLIPGEVLKCDLMLPASRSLKKSKMALHCTVEVLRIEERTLGFGWACRIQNYSVAE